MKKDNCWSEKSSENRLYQLFHIFGPPGIWIEKNSKRDEKNRGGGGEETKLSFNQIKFSQIQRLLLNFLI